MSVSHFPAVLEPCVSDHDFRVQSGQQFNRLASIANSSRRPVACAERPRFGCLDEGNADPSRAIYCRRPDHGAGAVEARGKRRRDASTGAGPSHCFRRSSLGSTSGEGARRPRWASGGAGEERRNRGERIRMRYRESLSFFRKPPVIQCIEVLGSISMPIIVGHRSQLRHHHLISSQGLTTVESS